MAGDENQWGTVSFTIPDFLEDARDAVNDFAELLLLALEIANLALEFIKAFVKGFLDPLAAIIDLLIEEIMAILRDLRQTGIYITSDLALALTWPPEDLRGGFQNYERRMIARLADRTDPTRPDVSSKSKVLGFFGYLNVDTSEFERLLNFIATILKMFGISFFPDTSMLPIPQIKETFYGPEAASVFNFSSLLKTLGSFNSPPQHCRVTWVTQPASMKHPANPLPVLGPSGYLVTVSTLKDGLQLRYSRSKGNSDQKDKDGEKGNKVTPREYGDVRSSQGLQPIVLHGGAEMLAFKGSNFEFNKNIDTSKGAPKDGCIVFGRLDATSNVVVPLEDLGPRTDALGVPGDGRGDEFLLQRTFLIEDDQALAQWFAGEYSTVLSLDDMPQAARWEESGGGMAVQKDGKAQTYYVRVWSVGKEIASGKAVPQWDFTDKKLADPNEWKSGDPFIVRMKSGTAAVGLPSQARKITYVGANTKEYLHALETALLILVLTRPDLPLLDELEDGKSEEAMEGYRTGAFVGQQFAKLATNLEGSKDLLQKIIPDPSDLAKAGQTPQKWRSDLHRKIRQVALDIYEQTGPMPGIEKAVVDATGSLRNVTWSQLLQQEDLSGASTYGATAAQIQAGGEDLPIFNTLDPELPFNALAEHGLCPNILSAGIGAADVDELFYVPNALRMRDNEFVLWAGGPKEVISFQEDDPAKVRLAKDAASGALKRLYERFTDRDGRLLIPQEWKVYFEALQKRERLISSGDMTPVWVSGASQLVPLTKTSDPFGSGDPNQTWPGMLYTRGFIRNYNDGELLREAAIVLRLATAAATRAPDDGEWLAIRLFDAFPELEGFVTALENWVKALAQAIESVADAIVKYIEFVQAVISDLQRLIRRINAMIQSLLALGYALPQFSGLMLLSDGTDGLMSDLVAADNKPSDSPLSYGAGVALVIPAGPAFIYDLIEIAGGEEPDPNALTDVAAPPDAIGIEQVEPAAGAPPSDEPDVL